MTRGRGFSSYRGHSMRSSWGGPGGDRGRPSYSSRGGGGRFSSYSNSMDSRPKYPMSTDRYSASRGYDEYKPYRADTSAGAYTGRDSQRSPERKRLRPEAPSSHRSHDADGFNSSASRYQSNSFSEHRSFSRDRRPPSYSATRDDFRRPSRTLTASTPRGGYRGRISSRGIRGARLRDMPPRRRMVDSSYAIRKRLVPRLSSDYTRRIKISRLRSAVTRRVALRKRKLSDKDDDDDEEEEKEKESENEASDEKKNDDDNEETEVKEEGDGENADGTEKTPKKEGEKDEGEEKPHRKEFIKLVCPHCSVKCLTFGKYSAHLHSSRHVAAMRHVAMKQKSILARMRLTQRNTQRELEKSTDDLAPRTNFCPLCKLNYKQPKATHQASDSHKSMKKFLMPYCRVCRITFKSPMLFETHICSIEHIKRKARNEINGEKSDKEEVSGNEEDNLESFMTIDSVGDVDDEEEGKKKDTEGKPKEKINVGIEQIRKVEVHYCELCRMYLPRTEDTELDKTLAKHCKQRTHMQRYIRYKEDKEIANRAERLQRKETAEKEREKNKLKDAKVEDGEVKEGKPEDKEKSGDDEEAIDDKLWADDVNKDLGDILAEAESGNKSSDEDEDKQRYDSEKNGEEKKEESGAKEEAASGEKKLEEVKEDPK